MQTPAKRLSKTDLCCGHAGQDQLNSCSLAGFAIKMEPAAQTIRDDGMDDVETQTSTALIPAGCEKWIEGFASDIKAHAASVVYEENFNVIMSGRPNLDIHAAALTVGERMRDRIEEEIGQHLPIRARITVHRQIGLTFDGEGEILLSKTRVQAHDDLFGQITEIKDTAT